MTDDAVEWLDTVDEPFFGWTHYMDVHHPCFPPDEYREALNVLEFDQTTISKWYSALLTSPNTMDDDEIATMKRLYDAAIVYVDDQIERLITQLRERGRLSNTLVAVTSDHGELFGNHGEYRNPARMYDELLRVPLIVVNGPDYMSNATDNLVSLIDHPPMMHDAVGISIREEYEARCPSRGSAGDQVMAEIEVEGDVIVGARSRNWPYEGDEIQGEHRLFDLRDGFSRVDSSSIEEYPEANELRRIVVDRLDELNVETRHLHEEVKGDVHNRLEDLGHL